MTDQYYFPKLGGHESARVVGGLHDDPAELARVLRGSELPETAPVTTEEKEPTVVGMQQKTPADGLSRRDIRAARREIGEVVRDIMPAHDAQLLLFGNTILRHTSTPQPKDYVQEDRARRQVAKTERRLHSIPGEPMRLARRR